MRPTLSQQMPVSYLWGIINTGLLRFMVLTGAIAAPTRLSCLKRPCRDAERKMVLILDDLNVHQAKDVRAWVAAHPELIAMYCLPLDAPERTPDEYRFGGLKQQDARRAPARDREDFEQTATRHRRLLQRHPALSWKFFEHAQGRYAA